MLEVKDLELRESMWMHLRHQLSKTQQHRDLYSVMLFISMVGM